MPGARGVDARTVTAPPSRDVMPERAVPTEPAGAGAHDSDNRGPQVRGRSERRAFEALRTPGFLAFVGTFMVTMMADNIEHVISYWVMHQRFHSEALGGFAVVSHWLPYLLFSVSVGALNDRFDSRRLIQIGAVLFLCVSLGWGVLFFTDSLQIWHAMVLLVMHGVAGVFWMTSSQVLLYDIVGPESLASAVRLHASARYLGVLVGPAVGSLILRVFGAEHGMFVNAAFYVPLLIWLVRAPYGRAYRGEPAPPPRGVRGLQDIVQTAREVATLPVLSAMILLAGAASFFIGNSYQAQMPRFADDLGYADPGLTYSMLLGADAAGALTAGFYLELRGANVAGDAKRPLWFAALWASSLAVFAMTRSYPLALLALFGAGFFELSFSSLAQTLVQMQAPHASRGRVLGLFSMSSAGLRTFSGLTVGVLGSWLSVHRSLPLAAGAMLTAIALLYRRAKTV